ncbi:hypothetical protein [Agrobacterium sp. T29]|uniref:hypothetical protein n=1 Tax=Agrobacterium sp. T29 TaxID=2580515 RepID=UPI00115D68D2|nr:hypothetical protein [Agrobacterium sp. T29]
MMLLKAAIVAPDTSHWANWIDAAITPASPKGQIARDLYQRLLDQGRIPFLSWHHLEELLVVDDPANARARVAYLQSLPLLAWMRMSGERILGGIVDILAAEAIAYDSGCRTMAECETTCDRFCWRQEPALPLSERTAGSGTSRGRS